MPPDRDSLTYRLLAHIARVAVGWYYRAVTVDGAERIPASGPVLLVVNHPNELMDAIFAGLISPRQLTFTGKATLFDNPALAAFLRHMRVVPLRRTQDESSHAVTEPTHPHTDPSARTTRNADAFAAIHSALHDGQMVLIFPEGRSWDEPRLAQIKTGAARIALSAAAAGISGVTILPIGINYERKEGVRSRVLVEVGQPIAIDALPTEAAQVEPLTTAIARQLHAVTLNFDDDVSADEVLDLATVLAAASDEVRPLGDPDAPLSAKVDIARRADQIRRRLDRGELTPATEERVRHIQRRLLALRRTATTLGIRLDDVALDTTASTARRFLLRELLLAGIGVPFAAWGRVNHFIPFSLARWLGVKTSNSRSQRAGRTIVLGILLILVFYAIQTAAVWRTTSAWWALFYFASLIPSASWDLRYTARLRQVHRRALAWKCFRDDPTLQITLRTELRALRQEAAAIASGVPAM